MWPRFNSSFPDHIMIKHYHKNDGDQTVYHDGSLSDCPETEWRDILVDGKPARFAVGMSITLPPNTSSRFRRIKNTVDIS